MTEATIAGTAGQQASRAPSNDKVVAGIQLLRAIAAILVVARHAAKHVNNHAQEPFGIGQFGVDLFFVISGFVIYLTGRDLSPGLFLRRRISRIVPLYWLALSLAIAARLLHEKQDQFFLSNALLSFVFVPARISADAIFPPVVVGWSLNYEAYFYAVFALCLAFAPRARLLAAVFCLIGGGIVVGGLAMQRVSIEQAPILVYFLPISCEFLGGMMLARLWLNGMPPRPAVAVALAAAAGVWLAVAPVSGAYDPARALTWGIPAAALVCAALLVEGWLRSLPLKPGLLLGDASYALYLVHLFVLPVAYRGMGDLPKWAACVLLVALSCMVAVGVHRLFELPLTRLANRLLGLPKRPRNAGAQSVEIVDDRSDPRR